MTTHELANLLDHLKIGLGNCVKTDDGKAFEIASAAIRELPDQPLKKLAEQLRALNAPPSNGSRKKTGSVNVQELVVQIRAVRDGAPVSGELTVQVGGLKNADLREILKSFDQKPTSTTDGNRARVMQLITHPTNGAQAPAPVQPVDQRQVDEGVDLFTRLRDTRGLSISDVRAGFEPLRTYPKAVVEEISRRVGYTPSGSREDILNRLLSNLEGIKMNQRRVDTILSGN